MNYLKILIITIVSLSISCTVFAQDLNLLNENKYNTVNENDVEIIHQGEWVVYGENFASVSRKWTDAKYAGKFDFVHSFQDEYYYGIADYKMIFDKAYFFFIEGKLAYFRATSDEFKLRLRPSDKSKRAIVFAIGKSIKGLEKSFTKTSINASALNERGYSFIFNLGEFKGGAAYFNDLGVTVSKSGKVTGFGIYGHF